MVIKILGKGCKKCDLLEKNARLAAQELDLDVTIEKVEDINAIAEHGVFQTPALVIDGQVKLAGKVASAKKIKTFLA